MMWLWEKTPLSHRKSKTLRRSQVHTTARASNLEHATHKRVHEVTQALTCGDLFSRAKKQIPSMDVGDQLYKFVFKKKFWFNEFTETELGANEVAFNLIYCQVRT
jgi:hypothetical protein